RVAADLELRCALLLVDKRLLGHRYPCASRRNGNPSAPTNARSSSLVPERAEQRAPFVVGTGGRADADVHAAHRVDLVVVDLLEDQLLGHTERVVAAPVERVGFEAAEVAEAGDRDADQPVVELPHAVAAQGDLGADRIALAELERR